MKVTFSNKRKPDFEQALVDEAQAAEVKKQKELAKAGRTETSTGPGDSPGPPDDHVVQVPDRAAQALAPVLKIPFVIWSNIENIPEIRLSDEEAQEWTEPFVELLEYYFPGKVPEIAWIWLCFLTATGRVIDSRIEIRHKHKEGSAAPQVAGQGPKQEAPGPTIITKHNGAEPAEDYPNE